MRVLLALVVLISLLSLDQAVVYQPVSPQPCDVTDYGFTDLAINCSSQVITITDAGTITGIRVGVIIEHGNSENIVLTLITPSRPWQGRSTGVFEYGILLINLYAGNDNAPILLFQNGGTLGSPNLGSPSTGQFFNMTAVADPVFGFEAEYWSDELDYEDITGNFGQYANNDDQIFLNLVGEEITGDWSLVITDKTANDTGRLIKWLIDIKYCGDGEVTFPEECDSGSGCDSCKCYLGYRPDPAKPGSCAVNSCGDGSVGEEEECDGGYGCDTQCKCQPGWTPNARRTSHCQLIGKQFTVTPNLKLREPIFDIAGQIDIAESGIIQSIKFGVVIEHAVPVDIYLWVVRAGSDFTFPLPLDPYTEAGLVDIDQDPAAIKLLGYYGSFRGATNVGNVQSGNPMFVGAANDTMFSASRLNPGFVTIEDDVFAAERRQSDKIAALIGTQLQGSWKLVGGDWNFVNDVNGTVLKFTIEALYCGDGIFNPWYEQCELVPGCNNRTCTCLDGFTPKNGSCTRCGDGQVDQGEECDSTENCSDSCKCQSGTSNGSICVVGPNDSALIGGLVGGLGGALVAGAIVLIVLAAKGKLKKKKKAKKQKLDKEDDVESGPGYSSVYSPIEVAESQLGSKNNSKSTEMQSMSQAAEDRMKIPWASLVFKQEIGMGGFGKVFIGEWQRTKIAIKVSTVASADDFLKEANLSVGLRPHPNVVQTLGVSIDGQFPALVLEFCAGGSLDKALQNTAKPMTYLDKLRIVTGIGKGMLHLHSNNIVHRDLAARNVLLSATGEPKISDFGMSRLVADDMGKTTRTTVGPIKWMAPESVKSWQYSKKSDVWSFGVVVWEVVTREEPYKGDDLMELALSIRDEGRTLEIPDNCEPIFKSVMQYCFQSDPAMRKDFDLICAELDQELDAQEAHGAK